MGTDVLNIRPSKLQDEEHYQKDKRINSAGRYNNPKLFVLMTELQITRNEVDRTKEKITNTVIFNTFVSENW